MKRSEMVDIIEYRLRRTLGKSSQNTEFADWILKDIEEAGMLPPYTPHKKEGPGIEITLNAWDTE